MRRVFVAVAFAALTLPAAADPGERISTLADQRSVSVTIYNEDLALVREERRLTLPRGESRIALRDVSARIQPETALFRSVTAPGAIDVAEQNFNFDLLSPETLLNKYLGRDVTIIHTNAKTGVRTHETARVLSTNDGIVLQYADRIETGIDGTIAFPTIPDNLRDRPTLTIDLENTQPAPQDVELTYLTGGMSWHADYVGELSADGKSLDLDGSVTLSNASGTTYPNAHLFLVAGDVHVVERTIIGRTRASNESSEFVPLKPQVSEIGDFHLYTMPRSTTIADQQTKQVSLLRARAIPTTKTLELRGESSYYESPAPDLGNRLAVRSYLTFINERGDLGVPLPSGTVRVYQRDVHGNNQFVGADQIEHTPRGQSVRLALGGSFDVTARRKQTDFHIVADAPRIDESSYQIVLSNAKSVPVTVLVVEPIPGDWSMLAESAPHVKSSSSTANWTFVVPANGSSTLTYTVRTRS